MPSSNKPSTLAPARPVEDDLLKTYEAAEQFVLAWTNYIFSTVTSTAESLPLGSSPTAVHPHSNINNNGKQSLRQIHTLSDLWAQLEVTYGADRMKWVQWGFYVLFGLFVAKLAFDVLRFLRGPKIRVEGSNKKSNASSKSNKKGKDNKNNISNNKKLEEEDGRSTPPPSSLTQEKKPASPTSPSPGNLMLQLRDAAFSTCVVCPAPSSQLYTATGAATAVVHHATHNKGGGATATVSKKKKGSAFPTKIGVLAVSPCQQYLVMSCRTCLEARVYPQSSKTLFMSKGAELAMLSSFYCSLGHAVGAAVGIEAPNDDQPTSTKGKGNNNNNDNHNKDEDNTSSRRAPPVDISCLAFLHSSPVAHTAVAATSGGGKSHSAGAEDPLLQDTSSAYCVVGESTKDVFVVLRLYHEDAGHGKSSAGVVVGAQVLWTYKPPRSRLVWQQYRLALFSSYSTHVQLPGHGKSASSTHHSNVQSGISLKPQLPLSAGVPPARGTSATVADMLVMIRATGEKDAAALEMVHRQFAEVANRASGSAKGGKAHHSHHGFHAHPHKFNVGELTDAVLMDPYVVTAGSFLREPRVTQLSLQEYPLSQAVLGLDADAEELRLKCYATNKLYGLPSTSVAPQPLHVPHAITLAHHKDLVRLAQGCSKPSPQQQAKIAETLSKVATSTTVQAMTVIYSHQPVARTIAATAGEADAPMFLVVVLISGQCLVYDLVLGASDSPTRFHKYMNITNNENKKTNLDHPHVGLGMEKPIAVFHDVAFAAIDGVEESGCTSVVACIAGGSGTSSEKDHSSTFPNYRLLIALVHAGARRVAVYGSAAIFRDGGITGSAVGEWVCKENLTTAQFTAALGGGNNNKVPSSSVQKAIAFTPIMSLVPLVRWSSLHPNLTRSGESNSLQSVVFVQNGLGIATVGDDDGQGVELRSIPTWAVEGL